jgi:taurine dioxygenase
VQLVVKGELTMSSVPQSNQITNGVNVHRLQPGIGAEITGIDLRQPLTPELRDLLKQLLNRHKVLFFRNQSITREQQIAVGEAFGELTVHPFNRVDEKQIVQPISAERFRQYYKLGSTDDQRSFFGWHSDETFRPNPPYASILRAIELPEIGGDTVWTDAVAAYQGLSKAVKERIANLKAVHKFLRRTRLAYLTPERIAEIERDYPPVVHPVVRIHPDTGEKVLFVNPTFTSHIIGLTEDESERLLSHLFYQITRPEYQVRFKWQKGSIAFWDNRATQHYAVFDYGDARRELERVTIKGQPLQPAPA